MATPAKPPAEPIVCAAPECLIQFRPRRSDARYCTKTCAQRAARARKAAAKHAAAESTADTSAEHGLVKAVRAELDAAGRLGTFNGQLAVALARRLANPDESGSTALSKELRAVMAEALQPAPDPAEGSGSGAAGGPGTPGADEDDEVTRARRQREEARQAAGLA